MSIKSVDAPSFGSRYRLDNKLGAGGMGAVYKGYDIVLDKDVAIKLLLPSLSSEVVVRFQQEAKAAARLEHPNILKVLDFGQTSNGDLYLVMDFIEGVSLDEHIKEQGPLSIDEAIPLFEQICDGLSHAHERKILHRDVKPSNVMVSTELSGELKAHIVDFGLAKLETEEQKLTTTGIRVGSPLYMSPEQAGGEEVDHRSDIYSLGCLMYKTLTGYPPLVGETYMDTITLHVEEPAPLLRDKSDASFPDEVEEVIARCLDKDPLVRFQSMSELRFEIEQLQGQHLEPERDSTASDEARDTSARAASYPLRTLMRHWKLVASLAVVSISVAAFCFAKLSPGEVEKVAPVKLESPSTPREDMLKIGMEFSEGNFPSKHEWGHSGRWTGGGNGKEQGWPGLRLGKRSAAETMHFQVFKEEMLHDPEVRKLFTDDEIKNVFSKDGKKRMFGGDPADRPWMKDPELFEASQKMQMLFNYPSLMDVWDDPQVREFVQDPENWKRTDLGERYRDNENIQKLKRNRLFIELGKDPGCHRLLAEKSFQNMLRDPLTWKMWKAVFLIMKKQYAQFIGPESL